MQGRIKSTKFRSKRNMKRFVEANISVVVLTAMISLMAVATVLTLSLNEKAMTRQHTQRMNNRYNAESCIDIACYMIQDRMRNEPKYIQYENKNGTVKLTDSIFSVSTDKYGSTQVYNGYIFDEIITLKDGGVTGETPQTTCLLTNIGSNTANYLYANGAMEFIHESEVTVSLYTGAALRNDYRLINMCTGSSKFFEVPVSAEGYTGEDADTYMTSDEYCADLDPLRFIITVNYAGGRVTKSIELQNVKVQRRGFGRLSNGEKSIVKCRLDTSKAKWITSEYQNYATDSDD